MGALEPHPALKAISPQASPADMWLGDDFHHNGAFRLSYGFEYATVMESSKEEEQFGFDRYDTYEWYLALGALSNVNEKYLHGKIPTWNDFVDHPDYDEFWKRQTMIPYLTKRRRPDAERGRVVGSGGFLRPTPDLRGARRSTTRDSRNYLVVGPWNHGGWADGEATSWATSRSGVPPGSTSATRSRPPGSPTGSRTRATANFAEALTFEAGSNQWRSWDRWPPNRTPRSAASTSRPAERSRSSAHGRRAAEAFDSYVSDPTNPVPYRNRPVEATYFPARVRVVHVAARGPALCGRSRRCAQLGDGAPRRGRHRRGRDHGASSSCPRRAPIATGSSSSSTSIRRSIRRDWQLSGWQLMVSNEVFRGALSQGLRETGADDTRTR